MLGMFTACKKESDVIKKDDRKTILIEIDEGIGGIELTSVVGSNYALLDQYLTNIIEGLRPLTTKYDVKFLIYPTWHYRDDPNPLNRVSNNLHYFFEFMQEHNCKVYLEIYSSGIRTNQNGEIASLMTPPLHYGESERVKGISLDMETIKALKESYPDTFEGLRYHELIGSNDIGLRDRALGKEETSHAFVVEEKTIKTLADTIKEANLKLIWSDHSWNLLFDKHNNLREDYAYWLEWLDYTVDTVGAENITLNWANNGWPMHTYIVDTFKLKNYRGTNYGMSVQSWFWQETDSSTMKVKYPNSSKFETKWYTYAESDMPIELMAAFTLRAFEEGATLVQYEPPHYIFNYHTPKSTMIRDYPGNYEKYPDYTVRVGFKRLMNYLVEPGNYPFIKTDLTEYYDIHEQRFNQNYESNPAKRYYQTTLITFSNNAQRQYIDRYNFDYTKWFENSSFRHLDDIFTGDIIKASRINLTFSASDEFMLIKRTQTGIVAEFYNQRSGLIRRDNQVFNDNVNGKFMTAIHLNLFSEYSPSLSGDGDDLVVVRKDEIGNLHFSVLRIVGLGSDVYQNFIFEEVSSEEYFDVMNYLFGSTEISSQHIVDILPIRTRNTLLIDSTRPRDAGTIILRNRSDELTINGKVNDEEVSGRILLDGEYLDSTTIDIDGDFVDEVAIMVKKGEDSKIIFAKLVNNQFTIIPDEEITLNSSSKLLFSQRICTYTKAYAY